jgi:zinc transport system permease protein
MVAFMTWIRVDLMGFLFGDILAVSVTDIAVIIVGGVVILALLVGMWRPLLAATVNAEVAEAEGMRPEVTRVILMLLLACVIAIAMKIVGVLLIIAFLIMPAAAARPFASTPEKMVVLAAVFGVGGAIGGLLLSNGWDIAGGPSIVLVLSAIAGFSLTRLVFAAGR